MSKRLIPPIENERLRLRLIEEADLPLTLAWRNQDHIRKWFFTSEPITPEQHQGWYARYRDRDDDFVFLVEEREVLCRPVGQVAIYHVDWASRSAEFGRLMIGDLQAQGMGLGREATAMLVDCAIHALNLRRLYLEVLHDNTRAIGIYESCGFEKLGLQGDTLTMHRCQATAERAMAD
jgi:RimJ/RimL family protein N-acetyltransferase